MQARGRVWLPLINSTRGARLRRGRQPRGRISASYPAQAVGVGALLTLAPRWSGVSSSLGLTFLDGCFACARRCSGPSFPPFALGEDQRLVAAAEYRRRPIAAHSPDDGAYCPPTEDAVEANAFGEAVKLQLPVSMNVHATTVGGGVMGEPRRAARCSPAPGAGAYARRANQDELVEIRS